MSKNKNREMTGTLLLHPSLTQPQLSPHAVLA